VSRSPQLERFRCYCVLSGSGYVQLFLRKSCVGRVFFGLHYSENALMCAKVSSGGQQNAQGYSLGGLCNFSQFGKGGSNTNRTILGIFPVWMRRSGWSQRDACVLGESDDPLGTALGNIQTDEITALGLGPCHRREMGKLLSEDIQHSLKLRRDEGFMSVHQLQNACLVLQKANVTQLVDLVGTNRPRRKSREQPLEVVFRGGKHRQPRPCQRRASLSRTTDSSRASFTG